MKYTAPWGGTTLDATPEITKFVETFVRTQLKHITTDSGAIVWMVVWNFTEGSVLADGTILRWGPQGSAPSPAQNIIIGSIEATLRKEGKIT